jgi:HAD superfamily hydrolase (TIGR01509 family)
MITQPMKAINKTHSHNMNSDTEPQFQQSLIQAKDKYLTQHGFDALCLKAVLFDMDGVLYDSMPNHAKAWSQSMTQFGLHMTPAEAYMHEGRTGAGTINLLAQRYWHRDATEEEIKRIYQAKSETFTHCPQPLPMPGAARLLSTIKSEGLMTILVTGSGQRTLLNRLNRSFPEIFDRAHAVTSFDVKHGKPNPEPYLMGLKKGALKPYEAIVIENAPLGVQASVAAGIFTIAVNTGPLPDNVLLDAGANLLLPSMESLAQHWEAIRRMACQPDTNI